MPTLWQEDGVWHGVKQIGNNLMRLEETDDHSFAGGRSYIWRSKDRQRSAHLTENEEARLSF